MNYLVLKNIAVTNANAISGFTWGFPAVTHFLGFVHALSRKAKQHKDPLTLKSCAIVCHQHQVHAYREKQYKPFVFALTRNPLQKNGKPASIVEEGRMNLKVSLVIECKGLISHVEGDRKAQCDFIKARAEQHKLAGGTVTSIGACYVPKIPLEKQADPKVIVRYIFRPLLPGFILADRSCLLAGEKQAESADFALADRISEQACLADSDKDKLQRWLDFWWKKAKPGSGYLVPIQIGYKKIAPTHRKGTVANVRDNTVPFSFVEAIHSIGEWVGTPSKIKSLDAVMWQYCYRDPYYLCHNRPDKSVIDDDMQDDF